MQKISGVPVATVLAVAGLLTLTPGSRAAAQHAGHIPAEPGTSSMAADTGGHRMVMLPLGGGWSLMGMAQAFPIGTWGAPFDDESPLNDAAFYLTQPAAMINVESPNSRIVLRTTLNFEGVTQPDGEYTFGGWGEGFIDKRHPHTYLHEIMLSWNAWNAPGGEFSISAGRGFAPYGTDDPMSRPAVKYPTNHHLSQILERWTVNGVYLHRSGFSVEAGVFGGGEPESPSDLSNIDSFADSWSARVAQRFGGTGTNAPWELSASYGHVEETHHERKDITALYNAALRHERSYGFGDVYALLEASQSDPDDGEGYWSVLGETRLQLGRHRPYYRVEFATRPEYEREGPPGTDGFYRYDHDAHAEAASRWQIHTLGYELDAYDGGVIPGGLIARPFVEVQYNRVSAERGEFDPVASFGDDRFWSVSAGFKLFLGGDAMRMGAYGVLDPMSRAMRGPAHGMDHDDMDHGAMDHSAHR